MLRTTSNSLPPSAKTRLPRHTYKLFDSLDILGINRNWKIKIIQQIAYLGFVDIHLHSDCPCIFLQIQSAFLWNLTHSIPFFHCIGRISDFQTKLQLDGNWMACKEQFREETIKTTYWPKSSDKMRWLGAVLKRLFHTLSFLILTSIHLS